MTKSAEDIQALLLDPPRWAELSREDQRVLLNLGMIQYGISQDISLIPFVGKLYVTIETHGVQERKESFQAMKDLIENQQTTFLSLLPIVVCEPDPVIAASAALDFLAYSPLAESGRPYALLELDHLLRSRTPRNIGAVFGGMVSFGEPLVRETLDATRELLTLEEISEAARRPTGFVTTEALDFWLCWSERLVADQTTVSESKLGCVASALVNQRRWDRCGAVRKI
jgi:hypothetical protein